MEKFCAPSNLGVGMLNIKKHAADYCHRHMHSYEHGTECVYCFAERTVGKRKTLDDASPEEWDAASRAVRGYTEPQQEPVASESPALWDLVVQDMKERDSFGERKYTKRLQAHNGRDFLADAYQEALDLAVYLRGAIYERDKK